MTAYTGPNSAPLAGTERIDLANSGAQWASATAAQISNLASVGAFGLTTNTNTSAFTLAASQVDGANDISAVALTGTLGAGATVTLPTVAAAIAANSALQNGQTTILRLLNQSSANYAWTLAAGTGYTLTGTATVAQNAYRDFLITYNVTAGTATVQTIGGGTV